jgi:hypothetical protein
MQTPTVEPADCIFARIGFVVSQVLIAESGAPVFIECALTAFELYG